MYHKKNNWIYTSAISISLLLLALLSNSCKREEFTPIAEGLIIAEDVEIIENDTWNENFISMDSSNYTLKFSQNLNSIQPIQEGNIIVSAVGEGMLREVTSVSMASNEITFRTKAASLTDAIEQGYIEFNKQLTIQQIDFYSNGKLLNTKSYNTGAPPETLPIDAVIYDIDGNLSTTNDQIKITGGLSYSWELIGVIDISLLNGINEINFGFRSSEELNLNLVAGMQYTLEKSVPIAIVHFGTFVVMAGPFPLVFIPQLKIITGINGYASASISVGITQSLYFDAGLQYLRDDGWKPYQNLTKDFGFIPPQLNMNAGAMAYIMPQMELNLYGVVGPYANLKLYGNLEADIQRTPWWELHAGIMVGAGVKLDIFDNSMVDFSVDDLIEYDVIIAQAEASLSNPPKVYTSNITDITKTSAKCGGNVTDQGSDPVTSRGVCWSTSPNPTISNRHTTNGSGLGNFTSNITDLSPGTKYYVRAYARSNSGTGYGSQKEFTTKEEGDINDVPDEVNDFLNQYLIETLQDDGLIIHKGFSPPDVTGNYYMNSLKELNTGLSFVEYSYKFFSQTADYKIKINAHSNTSTREGLGAFISGYGYDFSIYCEMNSEITDGDHLVYIQSADIYSGTITSSGIKNYQKGFIIIHKENDINDNFMDEGDTRIIYESDGLVERVSTYPYIPNIKSTSDYPGIFRK